MSRPLPCQLQNQTSPQCMAGAAQQPLHARWLAPMLSGLRNVRRPCVPGFAHRARLLSPIHRILVPKLCHVPSFATWQTARAVLAAADVLSLAWKSERWVPKRLLARARAPVLRAHGVRPRRTHAFTSASERRHFGCCARSACGDFIQPFQAQQNCGAGQPLALHELLAYARWQEARRLEPKPAGACNVT